MNEPKAYIVTKEKDLPKLNDTNFFHSRQFFKIAKQTPRQKPYMAIVQAPDGRVLAHLLAIVRYRTSWFPPYLYMHCRLLGEGVYNYEHEGHSENMLFGMMLDALGTAFMAEGDAKRAALLFKASIEAPDRFWPKASTRRKLESCK